MRRLCLIIALLLPACASDPTPVDLTGVWEGAYTHPTFPGTLTLTLTSTDETMTGTFTMRYAPSGGGVQTFEGSVSGTRPSPTTLSFSIAHSAFTWSFVGQLTNGNLMQGTWESVTSAGLNGLFEFARQ